MSSKPASSGSAPNTALPADASWIEHREAMLDEALDGTFPASDPPAFVMPQGEGEDARTNEDE